MLKIPDSLSAYYPNPVRMTDNVPVSIFRDHRWTLPIMALAAQQGLIRLPALMICFDRHRDFLDPYCGTEPLARYRRDGGSIESLVEMISEDLSPRDDDWVRAGMELGFIGDLVHFSSNLELTASESPFESYQDSSGLAHRVFRLGRPVAELSYKGALVFPEHPAVSAGLWDMLAWDPRIASIGESARPFILDIDLDYGTISWDICTFPFPKEVRIREFDEPCQSKYTSGLTGSRFLTGLIRQANIVTISTEPDYCGGADTSRKVLDWADRYLFDGTLQSSELDVDKEPVYPSV
jgi:hypothetical protein